MFVLDKDHHSIDNLFKMDNFSYEVDTCEHINSLKNLGLFDGCFERNSLLKRFYSRLFISLNAARHEILGS